MKIKASYILAGVLALFATFFIGCKKVYCYECTVPLVQEISFSATDTLVGYAVPLEQWGQFPFKSFDSGYSQIIDTLWSNPITYQECYAKDDLYTGDPTGPADPSFYKEYCHLVK